ncbi:MAG: hypothetical protein ABFS28_00275 [Bacteroidota bacterium]
MDFRNRLCTFYNFALVLENDVAAIQTLINARIDAILLSISI